LISSNASKTEHAEADIRVEKWVMIKSVENSVFMDCMILKAINLMWEKD
jgi:hypothetical protein